MLLAQVRPSPAPPLLYHAVLHPPLRSHCSDSHTGTLVFIAPLGPLLYECDVTALRRSSSPALLMLFSMFTWLPQPIDSQQLMPTSVRLFASNVVPRILMKSAA